MNLVKHFRDLNVYKNGFELALQVFDISKAFPPEEKYAVTDQVRRSSRSICANIAEAWRKRRYKPAFISKLSDAETEASETQVWLEFSYRHKYIAESVFKELDDACDKIVGQLVRMSQEADRWILQPTPENSSNRTYAQTQIRLHGKTTKQPRPK